MRSSGSVRAIELAHSARDVCRSEKLTKLASERLGPREGGKEPKDAIRLVGKATSSGPRHRRSGSSDLLAMVEDEAECDDDSHSDRSSLVSLQH